MTKKLKKFTASKKLHYFGIKNYTIYLSLGLHKEFQATEEAFSLKREHRAVQNIKFSFFSTFLGHFAPLDTDTDPMTRLNPDSGSGSETLILKPISLSRDW
jgi:hypothetical protein